MSEAHYECAATGELVPESDLIQVTVYRVADGARNGFSTEIVAQPWVTRHLIGMEYVEVSVLLAFGKPVVVYRSTPDYGHCVNPAQLDPDDHGAIHEAAATAIEWNEEE